MKGRSVSITTILVAAVIIALALFGSLSARNDERRDDGMTGIDRLENAIIIEGLEMDSETPPAEDGDEVGGVILYDDDFMLSFDRKAKQDRVNEGGSAESVLKDLRAKDQRWHVSDYTIKRGDNLWSIARKFGTHHVIIININGINNPDSLRPGRRILVPTRNGLYYTVRKGDTLSGIASRHRTGVEKILSHNGIKTAIRPGMKIFLPGGVAPVLRPAARRIETSKVARNGSADAESARMVFSWPARGRITSSFGNRRDPFTRTRRFHSGIDISLDPGTPIFAAANGTVIFSGWKEGYGNTVVLKHERGYITVYAHNSSNGVPEGETVRQGQQIALSGMTGLATGGHLHFEVRKYLTPLNPLRMLR